MHMPTLGSLVYESSRYGDPRSRRRSDKFGLGGEGKDVECEQACDGKRDRDIGSISCQPVLGLTWRLGGLVIGGTWRF